MRSHCSRRFVRAPWPLRSSARANSSSGSCASIASDGAPSVTIPDTTLWSAAKLSERYITDRFLPDKAIDVIDESGARARLASQVPPAEVSTLKSDLEKVNVEKEDAVIAYWMKEGGAKPLEISRRQRNHCEFRIAEKLLASNPIDVCTVKADNARERVDASCNGGNAMDVCKVVESHYGSDRVGCGFGKGGEKGSAQTALLEMAMALTGCTSISAIDRKVLFT
jgi:hypothetical protein